MYPATALDKVCCWRHGWVRNIGLDGVGMGTFGGELAGGLSSGGWTRSSQSQHSPTQILKHQGGESKRVIETTKRWWWEEEEQNWSCTASSPGGQTTDIEYIERCLTNSCRSRTDQRDKSSGSLPAPKGERGHARQPVHVHRPQNNAGHVTWTSQQAPLVLYVTATNRGHSTRTHEASPDETVSGRTHVSDATSVKIK